MSALSEQGLGSAAAATSSAEPAVGEGLGQGEAAGAQCASDGHEEATPHTHTQQQQDLTAETAHFEPGASHGGRGKHTRASEDPTVRFDTEGASQPSQAPASAPAPGAESNADNGYTSHQAAASTPGKADSTAAEQVGVRGSGHLSQGRF